MANRSKIFQTLKLILERDVGRHVKENGHCSPDAAANIVDIGLQQAGFTIVPFEPTTEMLAKGRAGSGYPSEPIYDPERARSASGIVYRAPRLRELYRDMIFGIPERSETNPNFRTFDQKLRRP